MGQNKTWQKVIKIIFKIISTALFIILLLAAAFLIYYYIANKIYASKGAGYEPKFSIYTIASGSMEPTIMTYDAVINMHIEKPEDLKVGDIITFISSSPLTPNITVTHRIKEITLDENGNTCYITKGDANNTEDASCARFNNVIGKVIIKIPAVGKVQKFLASKAGWLLCILIPALWIICKDILKITKLTNIKKDNNMINEKKKKNPKKVIQEKKRKEQIKRDLLNENDYKPEYFHEPKIKVVEKRKKKSKTKN